MKWHPTEESVLLSAGYDKKLALLDVRKSASSAVMMHLSADAEQACWNQDDANLCYVTTEDGKVFCYDARMIVKEGDACAPVWELQAFQKVLLFITLSVVVSSFYQSSSLSSLFWSCS